MDKFNCVAPCLFGLEKLVADELKDMGAENVLAENGRVLFSGGAEIIARANIRSRFAERVQILVGTFEARSFAELFDNVKALDWERYIGADDAFPVKGSSINSALYSIPDCQSIVKKAIVERLKGKYKIDWFDELGAERKISFFILKDKVQLLIDTSGEGLHKRGYRADSGDAPLKETLAAAMVKLSRIYNDSTLYDPFCGSGTILIEGALMARNVAPGMFRSFASEKFSFIPAEVWRSERAAARDMIDNTVPFKAVGSDNDPEMVKLAMSNAKKAGVSDCVNVTLADVADFSIPTDRGVTVTNPPYGERMLDIETARNLYRAMGKVFKRRHGLKYTVISPDEEFERLFGTVADKRRKLYNGSIRCQLYFYYK
ncbi:MAG: class I SAM-dependent RNA methyltransferase [Clostridia bacterium]|nr:class I SAM-dependent RNA methyltransferase [Clostridia bacterium]